MSRNSALAGKTPWQAARSENAAKRKAVRDARGPLEQLAVLDDRPGSSVRERRRLTKQVDAEVRHEYDTNPELRELLAEAADSPTVRRLPRRRRSEKKSDE